MSRTARAGLGVLLLLHALAVFAPLLASDLPLVLVAADRGAFDRARRTLPITAEELARAVEQGGPAEAERAAVELRLATLRRGLAEAGESRVAAFERSVARALDTGLAGDLEGEARALSEALELGDGLELEPVRSFPLLSAVRPLDAFLMGLTAAAATAPLWLRRRRRARAVAAVLVAGGLALAAATLGTEAVPVGIKRGLADGSIEATTAVFAPIPYGFAETHLEEALVPPSWWRVEDAARVVVRPGEPGAESTRRHLLGTDALGRDVAARVLHGGRSSLAVGLLATLFAVALGVAAGATAGILGGRTDALLLRVVEVVQSFPALLLVLVGVALVPERRVAPVLTIALAIGLVRWTGVARLVRAECLRLRELEFALAARSLGLSPLRIAFRHLLPSALPPVIVAAAFASSDAVLTESAISFLGLGTGPPIPSWGGLISAERDLAVWWQQLFPGLFVFATVLSYNALGEGLRERFDPRAVAARPGARGSRDRPLAARPEPEATA